MLLKRKRRLFCKNVRHASRNKCDSLSRLDLRGCYSKKKKKREKINKINPWNRRNLLSFLSLRMEFDPFAGDTLLYRWKKKKKNSHFKGAKHVFFIAMYGSFKKFLKRCLDKLEKEITLISFLFRSDHFINGYQGFEYPQGSAGGWGTLPYMGYIGMCRCEEYGFQAVYARI